MLALIRDQINTFCMIRCVKLCSSFVPAALMRRLVLISVLHQVLLAQGTDLCEMLPQTSDRGTHPTRSRTVCVLQSLSLMCVQVLLPQLFLPLPTQELFSHFEPVVSLSFLLSLTVSLLSQPVTHPHYKLNSSFSLVASKTCWKFAFLETRHRF